MPLPIDPKALEKIAPPATSQTFPMFITETAGRSRQIQLRGASLPFRGVEFGSKLRLGIDYFAGNNEAQAQVMGGEWLDTDMEGRWADIQLSRSDSSPVLANFPPIGLPGKEGSGVIGGKSFQSAGSITSLTGGLQQVQRARTIRDAFYAIQQAGQLLKVEWGSIVRYGFIEEFRPSHDREEDINWLLKWRWIGETNAKQVPKPDSKFNPLKGLSLILAALKAFLDEVNRFILVAYGRILQVQQKITEVTQVVVGLINAITDIVGLAFAPLALIGTLEQQFNSLKLAALDLIRTIRSIPGVYGAYFDRKTPTDAEAEAEYLLAIAYNASVLADAAYRQAALLDQFKNVEILAVYTVTSFETLRDVANKVYGKPDGWRDIAEFNDLPSMIAPIGSLLYIPKRS